MDEAMIWETCTKIFRQTFGDDRLTIGPNTTAKDIDGWDSLAHIQLLVAVEKTFNIRFNTGEMARLANVGEVVALIAKRTAQNSKR